MWGNVGSNGSESGEDAGGARQDQRAIALAELQRSGGSFILIYETDSSFKCVSAFFGEDSTPEEFDSGCDDFLEAAHTVLEKITDDVRSQQGGDA